MVFVAGCGVQNELGHLSADPQMPVADVERIAYDEHIALACGRRSLGDAGRDALVRAPYLQKVGATTAELLWVGTSPMPATLELTRPDGTVAQTVVAVRDSSATPVAGTQFVARAGGLAPESIYCYRVLGPGGDTWASAGFVTAPPRVAGGTVRFAVLGDLGERTADQFAVLDQLETVRSDFVLLAGDLAYDDGRRDEFEANVFGVYGDMMGQVPFFPASGNHDYRTEDAKPFREAFALFENGGSEGRERWYSFDWGRVHVAVLDTEKISDVQAQWLDRDLAASDRPFEIVLLHKPPFSSGSHGSDGDVQSTFVPIFAKHGVDLVLAGHDHDYERTNPIDGVTYIVSGGGGRGTKDVGDSEFTAFSLQVAHFVHVTVDPTRLRAVAIDALGEPFDEIELPLRRAAG
jgi:hypothetical protein